MRFSLGAGAPPPDLSPCHARCSAQSGNAAGKRLKTVQTIDGIDTNHGLTVYSGGHGDASQRLQRPVVYRKDSSTRAVITNSFNDAISAETFQHVYKTYAGHSGIDFDSGEGAPVVVMYDGEVIEAIPDWTINRKKYSSGNYVKIRSCTNPDSKSGFVHTYLHLSDVFVAKDDHVKKGQQIGLSGGSGGFTPPPACPSGPFSQWRQNWRSRPRNGKQRQRTQS